MSVTLPTYRVRVFDENAEWWFECEAEDAEHAVEQAQDEDSVKGVRCDPLGLPLAFRVVEGQAFEPDAPVRPLTRCGECGEAWDDSVVSARTPTPSGRCPFEDEHDAEGGCPVGDPDCEAPDDGEWHCHDACEAPDDRPRRYRVSLEVSVYDRAALYRAAKRQAEKDRVQDYTPESVEDALVMLLDPGLLDDAGIEIEESGAEGVWA